MILLEKHGVGSGASGRSGGGVRQSVQVSAEIPLAVVGAVEEARPTGTAIEDRVGYGKAVVW